MLSISNLTYRIAGRPILTGCSATLYPNHRIGLVGRNGAGKSTLLRLITGDLGPDEGEIQVPARWSLGMTTQDAPGGERSLIDTVLAADTERSALIDELDDPQTPPERMADIHSRLEDISAAAAPSRAARILAGLGFSEEAQSRPCSDFSGGWRMRVALAALLFTQPDLLLLDEPTNHLDLEATIWLEAYLKAYRGTILIVSHDRTLLNSVVTDIIHLEGKTLTSYKGNYDFFEKTRAERMALAAKQREKQEAQRAHIMSFVDRFRYKASKATQAQSRLKMLAKMQPIASVAEEWTVTFDFPTPQTLASPLFTIDNGEIGYGDDPAVLKRVNLRIDSDDRIALLGANGNGKSTLLKVLAGRLKVREGLVQKSGKLKIGYFAQHQTDELSVDSTPLETLKKLMPKATETQVRSQLGRFGFGEDKAETRIGNLSGGEKARLLFALISREAPHIILMDEPTNHLDVDSRQALVQAINGYDGAVIIVTHDPHLVELTADRLWIVRHSKVERFDGDMADYRRELLSERRNAQRESRGAGSKAASAGSNAAKASGASGEEGQSAEDRKRARQTAAAARAALKPLKNKVSAAEKRVEKIQTEINKGHALLADPAVYTDPAKSAKVPGWQKKLGELEKMLEEAEEEWLTLEAELEEAEALA
ncbi:MAG: ABC transporter ATP-binding protein [Alphaproteobacteria bacterium TMED89]|nr:glycosyl transferase family 1 [Rhodospirillaceae bacterium]RPH13945.1 MAG: ABC transporter ATP-binding protein [Alphaproteobacteria bacterium TMED89]